ncbi:MAG: hypothetical protein ACI38U_07780 [Corynebacterium sp.]|uniref:hypothetical protein n=1 Tax=Corynebacterium sp. TaxID=1720 RepID=UPI003EFBD58F
MAGYDFEAWKSNNAVDAERHGLASATAVAKIARQQGHKGVTAAFISEHCVCKEWHHTGSRHKRTDYFSINAALEYLDTEDGKADLEAFKVAKKKAATARRTTGTVEWVEWECAGRNGKKIGVDHEFTGEVTIKGSTITFDGRTKRLTGNYITFTEDNAAA